MYNAEGSSRLDGAGKALPLRHSHERSGEASPGKSSETNGFFHNKDLQVQIYPIVLLVKYKTVKQLREVRDPRYLPESLSQKDARHLQVQLSSEHKLFLDPDEMISKSSLFNIHYYNSSILRKQPGALKPTSDISSPRLFLQEATSCSSVHRSVISIIIMIVI